MEVDKDGVEDNIEDDDDDDLIDYNEDGTAAAVEAAAKADRLKNLREKFASQGKEYRTLLKNWFCITCRVRSLLARCNICCVSSSG